MKIPTINKTNKCLTFHFLRSKVQFHKLKKEKDFFFFTSLIPVTLMEILAALSQCEAICDYHQIPVGNSF